MYAELSGPLHIMLQVGKFDGRKGSKKKLAWTPEAEDAFQPPEEATPGAAGAILGGPGQGIRATDGRRGLCCRGSPRADPGRHVTRTRGVLESDPGRGPTPHVDREGEGDVRHCLCAQEVVWAHRIATGGGLYGPSVLAEPAQGARRHPLETGGKEGPMA